jgi:hypothetical protein
MKDIVIKSGINLRFGLKTATRTATAAGTGVDLQGYDGGAMYILPGTWTDGTHAITLQESVDDVDGDYADVAAADLVAWSATSTTDYTPVHVGNAQPTAISSAATAIYWAVGYMGSKRWIRPKVVCSGTTTGAEYTAVMERGEPRLNPYQI